MNPAGAAEIPRKGPGNPEQGIEKSAVEIVAPAGNLSMVAAALQAGAHAIYFGVENLNLRNQASGAFTLEDLPYIVRKCHRFGARAYLTLNSVIYDRDIHLVGRILDESRNYGVDAIIASDPAVIQEARERGLSVHLSTQVSVSNLSSVRFWSRYADVIVLARELDLSMIGRIVQGIQKEEILGPSGNLVRIEVFGHGALCIAVSGRCGMSLYSDLASANRGACRQNCRRKYTVTDDRGVQLEIDNEYIMSPNDICTLPFLDRVVRSGISMLKIEGRNRGPDYVQNTVSVYKEALNSLSATAHPMGEKNRTSAGHQYMDAGFGELSATNAGSFKDRIPDWMSRLEQVYHRGFSSGYYLGERQGWAASDGNQSSVRKVYAGEVKNYFKKPSVAEIELRTGRMATGQRIAFFGRTTGSVLADIEEIRKDEQSVPGVQGPALVTVPVPFRVRKGDQVYIMEDQTEDRNARAGSLSGSLQSQPGPLR